MRLTLVLAATMLAGLAICVSTVTAQSNAKAFKISGAEFDPEHICDASADWVKNIGLFTAPAGQKDSFAFGFLMHKLCSTDTNAASFGLISGVKGEFLNTPGALGFDFKDSNNGFAAHCGAGAPRFNVSMSDGFHFIGGCANGTQRPSPRGTGWTEVRFDPQNLAHAFPTVQPFATITSIALVFDEGSDNDPNGSPEIVLDNIVVNGHMAVKP